jgi:hypothetical protein
MAAQDDTMTRDQHLAKLKADLQSHLDKPLVKGDAWLVAISIWHNLPVPVQVPRG